MNLRPLPRRQVYIMRSDLDLIRDLLDPFLTAAESERYTVRPQPDREGDDPGFVVPRVPRSPRVDGPNAAVPARRPVGMHGGVRVAAG